MTLVRLLACLGLVGCVVEPSRSCECGRADGSRSEVRTFDCDDPAAEAWMRDYQDACASPAECACVCTFTECLNDSL